MTRRAKHNTHARLAQRRERVSKDRRTQGSHHAPNQRFQQSVLRRTYLASELGSTVA
jgi:hypothetical protein